MSESTPNDTPQPDQHESWDDILSQPIARLANDTTAGEGGWRAVRDISSYSPRRQDAPVQIPSPDSVLKLHMPQQSEGETPQQAKLPDSLADQLSLTWSARKRQRPAEEPADEPQGPVWPSSTPAVATPQPQQTVVAPTPAVQPREAPQTPRTEAPLWRRPLDLVTRVLRREEPKRVESEQAGTLAPTSAPRTAQATTPSAPAVAAPPAPQPQATAQPHATVQRMAEPAPHVTPRLDAAMPEEEQKPQQPGAAQSTPVDMTLAMPSQGQASQATTTPAAEEERNDIATPPQRTDATVQRMPEPTATSQPSPRREADAPATAQPGPASPSMSRSQIADIDQPSLPEVAQQERRSFLSWLRPRDVARAPVDRSLPSVSDAAPAAPQPTVQRATAAPPASASSETGGRAPQRTSSPVQQPSVSLPTAGAPLTHRSLGTPVQADDAASTAETPAQPVAASTPTPSASAPSPASAPAGSPDPGDPLPPGLQQRMESLLDVPLREVRVFRGQASQRITSSMRADAVTVGNQIHVAPGRGDASSPQGRALLGHELSHVAARQGASEPAQPRSDTTMPESSPAATPLPANVSPAEDESRAMRLEHAILRSEAPQQPARAAPRPAPAAPTPLSLEHRAPPPQIVMSPEAMTTMHGVHDDGWGGQAAAFQQALHDAPAAPWDRMADQAESVAGSAASSAMDSAAGAASSAVSSAAGAAGDEDGLIDRVVEAVINRIEHDGNVARERSSSFVPHFGG